MCPLCSAQKWHHVAEIFVEEEQNPNKKQKQKHKPPSLSALLTPPSYAPPPTRTLVNGARITPTPFGRRSPDRSPVAGRRSPLVSGVVAGRRLPAGVADQRCRSRSRAHSLARSRTRCGRSRSAGVRHAQITCASRCAARVTRTPRPVRAKQPACLGLNTERPVHRTGPALFMPWSDAPGLSAHTLVVRSVGQEDGSPQWGVVHEHTRRPTPVFMNTQKINSIFHRPTWVCEGRPPAPKQHTPTPVGWAFDGRPLQHCESRFWASNPKFPFVVHMNKQRRLLRALALGTSACTRCSCLTRHRRARCSTPTACAPAHRPRRRRRGPRLRHRADRGALRARSRDRGKRARARRGLCQVSSY